MSSYRKFSSALGLSNIDTISSIVGDGLNPLEIASFNSKKAEDVSSGGKLKSGAQRFKLTYPEDLFEHVGAFAFFNIRSSSYTNTIPSFGEIRLFMPSTLRISYGAQWDEISLPLQKIASLYGDTVDKVSSAVESSKGMVDSVVNGSIAAITSNAGVFVADNFAKSLAPSLSGELRKAGVIPSPGDNAAATNPFAALNYTSPQYRQLQLDFDFLARNADEAEEIRKILKAFKLAMHPGKIVRGDEAVFWDAPYIFEIYFFTPSAVNMFNFKKSALTKMDVDYGASGIQTFFKDGQPVHIKVNLEFKELGFLTREDIEYNY